MKYAMKKCISAAVILAFLICLPAVSAENKTVTLSVYSHISESFIIEEEVISADEYSTPLAALRWAAGDDIIVDKGYVKSAFSLSERQYGENSGWIYKINGEMPPLSSVGYKLRDGDRLEWIYVVAKEQSGETSSLPALHSSSSAPSAFSSVSFESSVSSKTVTSYSSQSSLATSSYSGSSHESPASSLSSYESAASMPPESTSQIQPENSTESLVSQSDQKEYDIDDIMEKAAGYLNENPGSWSALAIHSAGANIGQKPGTLAYSELNAQRKSGLSLGIARALLNAAACGEVSGAFSLAEQVIKDGDIEKTGLNGPVFALILLCSADRDDIYMQQKAALSDMIVKYQKDSGGFALTGGMEEDTDITAMAVSALSIAGEKTDEVQKAIDFLSAGQYADGSMGSMDTPNCESTAQAIIALTAAGVSADDARFVKNGAALPEALMRFASNDGGFSHLYGGESDIIATEQALMALAAYKNSVNPYEVEIKEADEGETGSRLAVSIVITSAMLAALGAGGLWAYKSAISKHSKKDNA